MADIFSPEKRSEVMSRIRSGDTKPEMLVRSLLHRHGFRFTVRGPKNKSLPGRPDVVLPKYRTVVFVHGCFWHGHGGCRDYRLPKTRTEFWEEKISANRARDARSEAALRKLGWRVVVVWTCEMKTVALRAELDRRLPGTIKGLTSKHERPVAIAAEDEAPYRIGSKNDETWKGHDDLS